MLGQVSQFGPTLYNFRSRFEQVKFLDRSDVDDRPELQILEFKVAAWTATPWDDGSGIQVHHNAASKVCSWTRLIGSLFNSRILNDHV